LYRFGENYKSFTCGYGDEEYTENFTVASSFFATFIENSSIASSTLSYVYVYEFAPIIYELLLISSYE